MEITTEELIMEDEKFLNDTWDSFTPKMKYSILSEHMKNILVEEYQEYIKENKELNDI